MMVIYYATKPGTMDLIVDHLACLETWKPTLAFIRSIEKAKYLQDWRLGQTDFVLS